MKKLILGMLASCFILAASVTQTKAQVSVSLNVGTWTPPAEYADASYYYLPDVDSYYYVPTHQYIYLSGNTWVWRNTLPVRYNYYNINDGYKVAVYRPRPYRYYYSDRNRYAHYRGVKNVIVRDRYYRPHGRVINRTHYVNRPTRVINRTHYVNRPTRVVNRTRIVNRPSHTRVRTVTHINRQQHGRPQGHVGNRGHGGGDRGHGKGHH
ncbi:hypothetical protein IDJ75_16385 [Mucilaginibacter rigui]|uniref:DUF3300 domain-containing protein n=1 Tax=Mucilaginibacter rigui TaxID=534635 RepID=A0ABR7X8J2_9SPHI|nr:hypothetical protein [Mucilaginibacter rigui]MBD1386864.1 hypothetical protein [Mucilaginibacter rigui]